MDTERLSKWADLLLDTGKRNNLINFKDSKQGTVEIVAPDYNTLFQRAEHSAVFEVYDPKLDDDEDESETEEEGEQQERQTKQAYIATYVSRLKRNQILAYNVANKPIQALKSIGRKARTAIEETGVNIAYIAFGFIHWTESDDSQIEMRAPILLAPIAVENQSAVEPYYVRVLDDDIIVNPTFTYKLQNEYGIKFPEYDEDDGIEKYLDKVSALLARLRWTVKFNEEAHKFAPKYLYKYFPNTRKWIKEEKRYRNFSYEAGISRNGDVLAITAQISKRRTLSRS